MRSTMRRFPHDIFSSKNLMFKKVVCINDFVIKVARSYFSKFSFLFHLKNHYSKAVNLKFWLKRSSRLDVRSNLCIAVAYILLCKLNYGYRNQARFH